MSPTCTSKGRRMSQEQILNCLNYGELVDITTRECPPQLYWLYEYFFPQSSMRMSDDGVFNLLQIIEDNTTPAQFANLCAVKGNVVETGASVSLESVKAPLIYEEGHLGVCDVDNTLINTKTGGRLETFEDRLDYSQARVLENQMVRLRKRLNIMVAELLVHGTLTIDGENVERTVIDFGRNPDNVVVLDDADRWCVDDPAESPLDQLDAIVEEVFECEDGTIDVLWKGNNITKAFKNHKAIVDQLKRQGESKCEECMLKVDQYPRGTNIKGQKLIAQIDGYRFWEVGKRTVGAELMEDDAIYLAIREEVKPIRGYAAIKDMNGVHRDPMMMSQTVKRKGIKWEFESRPLPFFANINATAVIKNVVGC